MCGKGMWGLPKTVASGRILRGGADATPGIAPRYRKLQQLPRAALRQMMFCVITSRTNLNSQFAVRIGAIAAALGAASTQSWAQTPNCPELTVVQKAAGFLTFTHLVSLITTAAGAYFAWIFFGHLIKRLWRWLKFVPRWVYEVIWHGAVAALMATPWWWTGAKPTAQYIMLAGCLFGVGNAIWLLHLARKHLGWQLDFRLSVLSLAGVYGALAWLADNFMVGFLAVAALMAALGFSFGVLPGMAYAGFRDNSAARRGTLAAITLLLPSAAVVALTGSLGPMQVFAPGLFWLTTFVASTGFLILSFKFICKSHSEYAAMQIAALLYFASVLYAGSVLPLPELQKIGGTFFVWYLLSKPWELALLRRHAITVSGLGLVSCAVVFWIAQTVSAAPERYARYWLF
jgi:energy-converting hydrogenase Eha subunit E